MNGKFARFLLCEARIWFSSSPSRPLQFSTAGVVKQTRNHPAEGAKNQNLFIVDYLINSCGLSERKAVAASASLVSFKSPAKPDAVLKYLRMCGLNDAQITGFISRQPRVLCSNVEKFLAPNFKVFQNLGMSNLDIVEIMKKTGLLGGKLDTYLISRIEFLRTILSNDQDLVKVLKRTVWTLTASNEICKRMLANISKFKEIGFSDKNIKELIPRDPRLFQLKPDLVNTAISRVESELGIPHDSGMFLRAVSTLCIRNPCTVRSKFQIFEDFGWSMSEIATLFRNQPACLVVRDEKLKRGLEFLMRRAGFSPSYIANRPTLLMVSFEKRLFPRYDIFSTLKSKDLISKGQCFYAAVCLSEKSFLERYVMKFKHLAPDVCEVYLNRGGLNRKTVASGD